MSMSTTARVVADKCDTAAAFAVLADYLRDMADARTVAAGRDKHEAARWALISNALANISDAVEASIEHEQEEEERFARDARDHDDSPSLDDHPWSIFQRGERE